MRRLKSAGAGSIGADDWLPATVSLASTAGGDADRGRRVCDSVGAVGGVAIGAIAGDAGKGAAIGAIAGTLAGGMKARKNKEAQQQQAEQAKAGTLQHFNKAFGVCMEGRGYAVK